MQKIEKKEYGSQELTNKPQDYRLPRYDTEILDQNIIITGASYLEERRDSHGTETSVWLLTVFLGKNHKQKAYIASNHAYVREIIKHFEANPDTPLHCRITTQGEAQARRYKLAEPEEKKEDA